MANPSIRMETTTKHERIRPGLGTVHAGKTKDTLWKMHLQHVLAKHTNKRIGACKCKHKQDSEEPRANRHATNPE